MLSAVSSYHFDSNHSTELGILFKSTNQAKSDHHHHHPASPPDLLHDTDEDDEDSLSTPSLLLLSPKQNYQSLPKPYVNRRKSVPHKSPSAVQDALQASLFDKSVVFQLDPYDDYNNSEGDVKCTSKIICGQSLLSALRKKVARARSLQQQQQQQHSRTASSRRRRVRAMSMIEIPRSHGRRASVSSTTSSHQSDDIVTTAPPPQWSEQDSTYYPQMKMEEGGDQVKLAKKPISSRGPSSHGSSGRPSRVKGPCQACQEASDGCMRKAFHWPFPSSQLFYDKGKPFVYLCNKCGLRYNKSDGCVCRHCRWVFCKEEKRKAVQHIDSMRRRRPDGYVDPDELIENFVCSPKYWACGRPWKVGWVLSHLDEDEDDDDVLFSQQQQQHLV